MNRCRRRTLGLAWSFLFAAFAAAVAFNRPAFADQPIATPATVLAIPSPSATTLLAANPRYVYTAYVTNSNAATIYCQLYNTAAITLGTTTPVVAPVAVINGTTQPFYIPPSVGTTGWSSPGNVVAIGCATTMNGSTGVAQNTVAVSVWYAL